jgi:transformation/transcription domain-associated protein
MQHFLTPIGVEGLLMIGLMSIGKALTEPEVRLKLQHLAIALRVHSSRWTNSSLCS